ncbi:hypothetical protein [Bacterioplanoides sp.]|uniref:hypothetical protein n=1 Tax=Bacterioplanoides sp. TaxID=2066072 RepID=UPI003B008817
MRYLLKISVFLLLMLPQMLLSENNVESCQHKREATYIRFLEEARDPNGNTAQYFNLKYLSEEMKSNGIPNDEISTRLIKYIGEYSYRHSKVSVISSHIKCEKEISRGVFKINSSSGRGYVSASYIGGKLVGLSFIEKPDDIDFKSVDKR